jgi:hypothetical protein
MTTLIWQPHLTMAAAQAAGLGIGAVDIEILPRPHKQPGRLPVGKMAVYVFSSAWQVLKIGKAGPNSHARFSSHHYAPGRAMSTLAGKIIADRQWPGGPRPDPGYIGEWIKRNCDRVNLLLDSGLGTAALTSFEEWLIGELRPRYEAEG